MSVLLKQLDAMDAQIALLKGQVEALRHALTPQPSATTARVVLPERCTGVPIDRCALQDDDAQMSRSSFSDPNAWECAGCRVVSGTPTAMAP